MHVHMILASSSEVRAELLRRAGLDFDVVRPRIDEQSVKAALVADAATPRDIADCLAEMKARKVSDTHSDALVIGCDQVLDIDGRILSKPDSREDCCTQLAMLGGRWHKLHSAAVIYMGGGPVWRHIGTVELCTHTLSDEFIQGYVVRNWDSIQHAVGGYKLEEEGVRLFSSVRGDYFHVLGLPLLEILGYLILRGELDI